MSKNTKVKSKHYTLNMIEQNGDFRIVDAEQLELVNQYAGVFKRINARELARKINNGKLIIK